MTSPVPDHPAMLRRLRALAFAGLALAAILAAIAFRGGRSADSGLQRYGQLGSFALVDASGSAFESSQLEGKVWIASFIFTSCKNSCPMLTLQMKRLAKALPAGKDFALVSFSVDPEVDKPSVLADYVAKQGLADPRWSFLTGSKADLKALIQGGFKLSAEPGDKASDARGQADILHSSKLVLVDRRGALRGYYDGLLGASVEALRGDAERLAKEPWDK